MKQLVLFSVQDQLTWLRDPAARSTRRGRYTPTEIIDHVKSGIAMCLTDRAIGRQLGIDGKTVASVRADLESRGEIPQIKERLIGKLLRYGEAWFDRVNEGVQSGKVDPGQLSVPAGIAITKSLELSAGLAGPIAAIQVNVSLESLRSAVSEGSTSELSSDVISCKPVS